MSRLILGTCLRKILVHDSFSLKQDDRLLVRHCATHPRNPSPYLLCSCFEHCLRCYVLVGSTSLKLGSRDFTDDIFKSLKTVRTYKNDFTDTSLVQVMQHLTQAQSTLCWFVEETEYLPGLALLHG